MFTQEIKKHEMTGLLRKLTERDIMLIVDDGFLAELIFLEFKNLARNNDLGNHLFFDSGNHSFKFRSAPGVVHELRIRPADEWRLCDGYGGDLVIHSAQTAPRSAIQQRYRAVWLHEYIKNKQETEGSSNGSND